RSIMAKNQTGDQKTNGIDPVKAKRFVGEIDRCFDELASERGSYMARCRGIRDRIKGWKEQAADAGIPRGGLNHLLKRRELQTTIDEHEAEAEADTIETADMIDEALGGGKGLAGTALGAAAGGADGEAAPKKKTPGKKGGAKPDMSSQSKADALNVGAEDEPDLRGKQQKEREAQRKAEAEERLKGLKSIDGDGQPTAH